MYSTGSKEETPKERATPKITIHTHSASNVLSQYQIVESHSIVICGINFVVSTEIQADRCVVTKVDSQTGVKVHVRTFRIGVSVVTESVIYITGYCHFSKERGGQYGQDDCQKNNSLFSYYFHSYLFFTEHTFCVIYTINSILGVIFVDNMKRM